MKFFYWLIFAYFFLFGQKTVAQDFETFADSMIKIIRKEKTAEEKRHSFFVIQDQIIRRFGDDQLEKTWNYIISETESDKEFLHRSEPLRYLGISYIERLANLEKGVLSIRKAVKLLEKDKEICWACSYLQDVANAYTYPLYKQYAQAEKVYLEVFELAKKSKCEDVFWALLNTADRVYETQGNFSKSLEYKLRAANLVDSFPIASRTAAHIFDRTGYAHYHVKNYTDARRYWLRSLDLYAQTLKIELVHEYVLYVSNFNSIALTYQRQDRYDSALYFFQKCFDYAVKVKNPAWVSISTGSMGEIYAKQGFYQKALECYQKNYDFSKKQNENSEVIKVLLAKTEIFEKTNQLDEIEKCLKEALILVEMNQTYLENNFPLSSFNLKKQIFYKYSFLESQRKNFVQAYKYLFDYTKITDTLYKMQSSRETIQVQSQYDVEKQIAQNKILKQQTELQNVSIRNQQIILVAAVVVLLLLSHQTYLIYKSRQKTKKAQLDLEEKNKEILEKSEELKDKNEDIINSITYAQRIQKAILPNDSELADFFGKDNFFVLYKPRDIVSGDFYWLAELDDKIVLTVADCTGHGVPGAFMSMIGNDWLNQIVIDKKVFDPDQILNQLKKGIYKVLKQGENNANDGMDMAMITLYYEDKQKLTFHKFDYAGAMNPLYYIQNGELSEIKATKRGIGGDQIEAESSIYQKHSLEITQETIIYLCSDGYQDQFGGEKNKKFMTKNLKNLFADIHATPMKYQQKALNQTIEDWMAKSDQKQLDDITILGIKLKVYE